MLPFSFRALTLLVHSTTVLLPVIRTLILPKVLLWGPGKSQSNSGKGTVAQKLNSLVCGLQKLEQNLPRSVLSMMVAEKTSSGVPPSQQVARDDQLSRTDSKFVDEVIAGFVTSLRTLKMLQCSL